MPPSFFDFFCENATVDFYRGGQTKPSVKYETPLFCSSRMTKRNCYTKIETLFETTYFRGIVGEFGTADNNSLVKDLVRELAFFIL